MTLLPPSGTAQDQQAWAAQLLAEASRQDMGSQRRLIEARSAGATNDVYWEGCSHLDWQALERHRKDQVQCALIRIHLASEGIRKEIARSRTLLGLG